MMKTTYEEFKKIVKFHLENYFPTIDKEEFESLESVEDVSAYYVEEESIPYLVQEWENLKGSFKTVEEYLNELKKLY